jgi:hypothetical protein
VIVMGYLSYFPRLMCFPIVIVVVRSYGTCEMIGMSARSIIISTCGQMGEQQRTRMYNTSHQAQARQAQEEDHVSKRREDNIPMSRKLLRWSRGFGIEGAPGRIELRRALAQPEFIRQRILQAEYGSSLGRQNKRTQKGPDMSSWHPRRILSDQHGKVQKFSVREPQARRWLQWDLRDSGPAGIYNWRAVTVQP